MQQTASGPQRERGKHCSHGPITGSPIQPTDQPPNRRSSASNGRCSDRTAQRRLSDRQPLAFSNRQLSVGRIRPYFSSSALFNVVTIAPSKAKSATLFQWSELFCKSATERPETPAEILAQKRNPPDLHPLKVWRAAFTPKQCARRRFKTPPALCGNSPIYRIALDHSSLGLPRPEDVFQMNAFQSNKSI